MTTQTDPSDEFADNLNQALMMGIEEAGGYELVQPSTWESATLLQADVEDGFKMPLRFGSPATTDGSVRPETQAPETEAIDALTKDMTHLVKQIQHLRHLGIEDSKIALPKICVVGDQSTGKSSLIEGMSEIKVPRSAGTCTRCPMEINLSESDQPWKCSVSLCFTHMYSTKGGFKKVTKTKPLGPWHEIEPFDEPFMTLYSKDGVQEAIKRAQLAILNPDRRSDEFKPESSWEINEKVTLVKFSPNVIRLDISAPGFPNLSFYDLPGVISQAEVDEEAYLVTLVENLVKYYVSQQNCIILLTLPMTDDATNSSAARIVRSIKATDRTLGVLTKPDRVEDISQWSDLLSGHKFHLGHGYYVVRNNPDPSVGHREARREEDKFFSSGPWTDVLGHYKSRLGTKNLQSALSQLLISQIKECLPHVERQIREKVERANNALQELPAPIDRNAFYILCSKLQELKGTIPASLEGGSPRYPMLKIWNKIALDFAMAIQRTRPSVELQTEQESRAEQNDCNNEEQSDCQFVKVQRAPRTKMSPEADSAAKSNADVPQIYHTDHFRDYQEPARTFELLDIRGYNEDCSSGGLHNQIHPKAIETMNQLSISHWGEPMSKFLQATYKEVKKAVMQQITSVLSGYEKTELYCQVSSIARDFLSRLKANVESHAEQILYLEKTQPIVRDHQAMQKNGEMFYTEMKKTRKTRKAKSLLQQRGHVLPQDPAKADKLIEQTDVGPDPFENELKMMAISHAHYKVASSRFVDYLCMNIQLRMFSECKRGLFDEIETRIGIGEEDAPSRCAQLLANDPDQQIRREFLLREREKLEMALQWLGSTEKYGISGHDDDVDMADDVKPYNKTLQNSMLNNYD